MTHRQDQKFIVRKFKNVGVVILLITLFSCAGEMVKPSAENKVVIKTTEFVDVDADRKSDFKKAVGLMKKGQYKQAVTVLNSVISREKRLPAPYVDVAIAYNKLGDEENAEDNLISALKLNIGHSVANNELGLLYRKQGKFKAARTAYENAIRKNSEYLPAIINLGVLCDLYMHDYDCALQQYENYLAIKPDDKKVTIWLADVKQRLGK